MMSTKTILLVFLTLLSLSFIESHLDYLLSKSSAEPEKMTYLALGDSYTIGESVAENERWPVQLAAALHANKLPVQQPVIIAKTGWRTDQMLSAARRQLGSKKFDMVSLLIGVNNEFQGKSVTSFETEFRTCLTFAIQKCNHGKKGVFVLSIPDYGYTPFGEYDQRKISKRIDQYNAVCKAISAELGVAYYDITPISRNGLTQENLVANDGLHPSGEQYRLWVNRYFQEVLVQLREM